MSTVQVDQVSRDIPQLNLDERNGIHTTLDAIVFRARHVPMDRSAVSLVTWNLRQDVSGARRSDGSTSAQCGSVEENRMDPAQVDEGRDERRGPVGASSEREESIGTLCDRRDVVIEVEVTNVPLVGDLKEGVAARHRVSPGDGSAGAARPSY